MATLTRVAPDSARETLGAFLSPAHTTGPQLEKLKGKASEFADCIRTGRISREDAEHGMRTSIWKTLKYPLAVTSFDKDIWDWHQQYANLKTWANFKTLFHRAHQEQRRVVTTAGEGGYTAAVQNI